MPGLLERIRYAALPHVYQQNVEQQYALRHGPQDLTRRVLSAAEEAARQQAIQQVYLDLAAQEVLDARQQADYVQQRQDRAGEDRARAMMKEHERLALPGPMAAIGGRK